MPDHAGRLLSNLPPPWLQRYLPDLPDAAAPTSGGSDPRLSVHAAPLPDGALHARLRPTERVPVVPVVAAAGAAPASGEPRSDPAPDRRG